MASEPRSREEKSAERKSESRQFEDRGSDARGLHDNMADAGKFDPNVILTWESAFQSGERSMNATMPICQGTVRTAIETGYPGSQWMESYKQYDVTDDGVTYTDTPGSPSPGGQKPDGPVVPSAPVSTAIDHPTVPDSAMATADDAGKGRGNAVEDMLDDPEKVIERFFKTFQVSWQVNGKHNPETGEFEVQGFVVPGEEGEASIGITPRATADSDGSPDQPGQIVVSLARGEKLIQSGDEAPVLTEIVRRPLATQTASGAGNIADSNYTSNGDVKLNGLFNAIGFLTQLALGAKLTFIINLGTGAGADTGSG